MAHICTRLVTLEITGLSLTYFTMDEAVGSRWDVNSAIELPVTGEGAPTGTGSTDVHAAAGLYSNCIEFRDRGFGFGFNEAQVGVDGALITDLAHGSDGFSLCFWINVASYGLWEGRLRYGSSHDVLSHSMEMHLDSVQSYLRTVDEGIDVNITNIPNVTGAWRFWHMFFDSTAGRWGYAINAGASAWASPAGQIVAHTDNGYLEFYQRGGAIQHPNVWRIDEVCLSLSRKLTDAEVTYLYNSGSGRTWPIVFP